tara:strand:- start:2837 stop:3583 length:747 start_codon:yes stop_codon:yes gene_type:complete
MNRIKLLLILVLSIGLTGCVAGLFSMPEPVEIPVVTETVTEGEDGADDNYRGFQLQSLPGGWTVDRHPVAKWGMSLPTVMSNVLDSAQSVEYWEEVVDLPTGYKLPLKRSKVLFQVITRLTIETVELHFVNVDHIYSNTNHEPSHYILNGVVRGIELKPTGFPELTADDVVKYKFLMTYGTPNEFVDGFHQYKNHETVLKVREMDNSHVQIQMNSVAVDEKMRTAIDDMYSEEGIEYQKKLLLRAIDF